MAAAQSKVRGIKKWDINLRIRYCITGFMSHLYFCMACAGSGLLQAGQLQNGRLPEIILAPKTPLRYNYKMGIIEPFPGNITESEEAL